MAHCSDAFKTLYDIIIRLRGPGGCPWDREQTPSSLRGSLIEETYECIEAIDEQDPAHIQEELGDLFLMAVSLACIHEEQGLFSTADALQTACEKLIRRHPHVFAGEGSNLDSPTVLENWEKIKAAEKGRKPKDSILDAVSAGIPPLDRANELQKKAAKAGFDWPDIAGVTEKIHEELGEVQDAVANAGSMEKIEEELGDLLFSIVNICRFLGVEPSVALNRTNSKFIKRFKYMEKCMKESGHEMKQENLNLMDRFWNDAKCE